MDVPLKGSTYQLTTLDKKLTPDSPRFQQFWKMVRATCERGDNVGYDEFLVEDDFISQLVWKNCTTYAIENQGQIVAGMLVRGSGLARSMTMCLANITIFRNIEMTGIDVYRELVRLGESLAKTQTYCCVEISLFIANIPALLVLKQEGYSFAVCMEDVIRSPKKNLTRALTMYKDLGVNLPVVKAIVQTEPDRPEDFRDISPPKVPFLPLEFVLKSSGQHVVIRNMRNEESELVYRLYRDSAGRGEGYAVDEYTGLADFVKDYILEYYTALLCDKASGEVMGAYQFGRTVFKKISPSADCPVCDAHLAMTPHWIGKGLVSELGEFLLRTCVEMGFTSMTNDTLLIHIKMIKIMTNNGFAIVGHMPNTTYVKGVGWIDCVYLYKDLTGYGTLSEIAVVNNAKL